MDNDSDLNTDFKDITKDESNEDIYLPKKKGIKMDKTGKRSARKSKYNHGTRGINTDGNGTEGESRPRPKAKQ